MPRESRSSSRDRDRDDERDTPSRGRGRDDDREERGGRRDSGGSGGSRFQYRGRTSEEVSRRAKQSSGRYDSFIDEEVIWFSPREGENCIRIIPWASAGKEFDELVEKWGTHWGIDLITHMGVGADKGTYLCLDKMKGEPCPICDAYRDEAIDSLKPKDRVLTWLIDRDDEKSGPKLWAMPMSNSKDISGESMVKGSGELLAIDDPEEGYDVYFIREGTKRNTRYKQFDVARDPSPLSKDSKKMDKWLDYVTENPLPNLLKFYDPEHLEKVLSGQASAREEAEDEGEERSSRRGGRNSDRDDAPPSRRGRRDEPNADDPPPRSSRRGRGDPDDDERDERNERGRRGRGGDEEEFTRPSRRPSRDDKEPEGASDDNSEDKPATRGSKRSRDPEEPEADDSSSRGRRGRRDEPDADDPPPRERYRGKEEKDADDPGDDTRERLSRVGRRSR